MKKLSTTRDLLLRAQVGFASKTAVVEGSRLSSYEDLHLTTNHVAKRLRDAGVRKGDRVAVYSPRTLESVSALFGIWFAGGVAVFINEALKSRQVDYILKHSDAKILLASNELRPNLSSIPLSEDSVLSLEDLGSKERALRPEPLIEDDLAMIIYTSGSTGMPKGIMLSHNNLLSGAQIVSDYLRLSDRDILISLLPFSFDYGLNQLLSSLHVGGTLVIQRSVFPADICNTLLEYRVTGMAGVPMLWQQLAHPRSPFTKTQFPHLRYMTNTGGRMPEHLTRTLRLAHPHVQIYLMYGLTEAFRSTYLPPDEIDRRPTSIGKAIPKVEILVINEEGKECGPGEVGELVHRGANISLGYWKDAEATGLRFRPHPHEKSTSGREEIVVFSGDFVKRDEDGYIYFVGRKDQMIKSHGFRVSPEEIEEFIFASGIAAHVVAFGIDTGDVEQQIVAAVVPRDHRSFTQEILFQYCKKEMPMYLQPRIIWQCDRFPQTSSGKPDRVRIKELYLEQASSPR